MVHIGNAWDGILQKYLATEGYGALHDFLKKEYAQSTIYPPMADIFNAFKLTDFSDVKAVILGQDPYHGAGQAHGLAFSVRRGVPPPPSLLNIYKEQLSDLGIAQPTDNGCLESWAKSGVLLLNAVLTTRDGCAGAHAHHGWEELTDGVLAELNNSQKPMVFMLWGAYARAKKPIIDGTKHLILEAPHPSPLSVYRGFYGCRHFSKANDFLKSHDIAPIDWQIGR